MPSVGSSVEKEELLYTTNRNIHSGVFGQIKYKWTLWYSNLILWGIHPRENHISIKDMYKNFNHSLVCSGVGGMKFVGGIRGNLVSFTQGMAK